MIGIKSFSTALALMAVTTTNAFTVTNTNRVSTQLFLKDSIAEM